MERRLQEMLDLVRVLPSWFPCRLFLGPGFRLGARWNRLVEPVKTRKKRGKTGKKWARYGLKGVATQVGELPVGAVRAAAAGAADAALGLRGQI